eukprot:gb/GECG01004636.1/.p1 GENE.gb/GECG01004636.1/~~gb/GECG01004636.1/.p1  ORF type:complete len:769 (+),score=106.20 gb/GECG01004636.1/:1-2307(+)
MQGELDQYFCCGSQNEGILFSNKRILQEWHSLYPEECSRIDFATPLFPGLAKTDLDEQGIEELFQDYVLPRIPSSKHHWTHVCEKLLEVGWKNPTKQPPSELVEMAKQKKEDANSRLSRNVDFVGCVNLYSEAIVLVSSASPHEETWNTDEKRRFLAICLANRSVALLRLENTNFAFQDALTCVLLDPQYSKGWYRLYTVLEKNVAQSCRGTEQHRSIIKGVIRWIEEEEPCPPPVSEIRTMLSELSLPYAEQEDSIGTSHRKYELIESDFAGRSLRSTEAICPGESILSEATSVHALLPNSQESACCTPLSLCATTLNSLAVTFNDRDSCHYVLPSLAFCAHLSANTLEGYFTSLLEFSDVHLRVPNKRFVARLSVHRSSSTAAYMTVQHALAGTIHPELALAMAASVDDQRASSAGDVSSDIGTLGELENNMHLMSISQLFAYALQAISASYLIALMVGHQSAFGDCGLEAWRVWKYLCIAACNTHVLAKTVTCAQQRAYTWVGDLVDGERDIGSWQNIERIEHLRYALGLFKMSNMVNHSRQPNCQFKYTNHYATLVATGSIPQHVELFVCYSNAGDVNKLDQVEQHFRISENTCEARGHGTAWWEKHASLISEYWDEHKKALNSSSACCVRLKALESQAKNLIGKIEESMRKSTAEEQIQEYQYLAKVYDSLAQVFAEKSKFDQACVHLESAIGSLLRTQEETSPEMGHEWLKLAQLYFRAEYFQQCKKAAEKAHKVLVSSSSNDDPHLAEIRDIIRVVDQTGK